MIYNRSVLLFYLLMLQAKKTENQILNDNLPECIQMITTGRHIQVFQSCLFYHKDRILYREV